MVSNVANVLPQVHPSHSSDKGDLLHILFLAQLHKAFPCSIAGVEDLLQQIQDQIGGTILAIPLPDKNITQMNESGDWD